MSSHNTCPSTRYSLLYLFAFGTLTSDYIFLIPLSPFLVRINFNQMVIKIGTA